MPKKENDFFQLINSFNKNLKSQLTESKIDIRHYHNLVNSNAPKLLFNNSGLFYNFNFIVFAGQYLGNDIPSFIEALRNKLRESFHTSFIYSLLEYNGRIIDIQGSEIEEEHLLITLSTDTSSGGHLNYYMSKYNPNSLVVFDADNLQIIDYNSQFKEIFETDRDILDANISDILIHNSLFELNKWVLQSRKNNDSTSFFNFRHLTKNGIQQSVCQKITIEDEFAKRKNIILLKFYHTTDKNFEHIQQTIFPDPFYRITEHIHGPSIIVSAQDYNILSLNRPFLLLSDELTAVPKVNEKILEIFPGLQESQLFTDVQTVKKTGEPFSRENVTVTINSKSGHQTYYFDYELFPLLQGSETKSILIILKDETTDYLNKRNLLKIYQFNVPGGDIENSAIFDFDYEKENYFISRKGLDLLQLPKNFVPNKYFFKNNLNQDDYNKVVEMIKITENPEGEMLWDLRFEKDADHTIWLNFRFRVKLNATKKIERLYGIFREVRSSVFGIEKANKNIETSSLIKEKNQQIDQYKIRFNNFVEDVDDYVIILLDKAGYVMSWNKGLSIIFDYSEEEIVGKNMSVFFTKEDIEDGIPNKNIQYASKYGKLTEHSWRVKKNGQKIWVASVLNPARDKDGNIIYYTNVIKDLTQSMLIEQRLKEYTSELENRNKELEQFAYIASHDLQEPVRKIVMFSDLFFKEFEQKKEDADMLYLNKIMTSAKRMSNLINGILDYSRVSSSSREKEEIDLKKLILSVAEDFDISLKEKNIQLDISDFPVIEGHQIQLKQLFANLMSNAIKFTSENPRITVTSRLIEANDLDLFPNNNFVEIKFSDNGIGFKKEYKHKIFDMFQRLHDKNKFQGTGIGLTICKKIVENHSGQISVDSDEGKGTVFTILLPIKVN